MILQKLRNDLVLSVAYIRMELPYNDDTKHFFQVL